MIGLIVQARMGSSRLPGKVMKKVRDKPLLYYSINQLKQCKTISKLIIATTTFKEDDIISDFVKSQNVSVFRGDAFDVLERFYNCAKKFQLKIIVRISADSPLIDCNIVDRCVTEFLKNQFDYLSNTIKKINDVWKETYAGFPLGYAVEVFTFEALERAWIEGRKPSDREHVTEYIWHNPQIFRLGNVENLKDDSRFRLVVDYKEDFELVKTIIENFPEEEIFTLEKVIKLIEDKTLARN